MKRLFCMLTTFFLILSLYPLNINAESLFTKDQQKYLNENKDRTLSLGLSPYAGADFFEYNGKNQGYVFDVVKLIEENTGLNIKIISDRPWNEVNSDLKSGSIDLIFGANATAERLQFMSFTKPIHKYPYAVFAKKGSDVQSIGDLDLKNMGFISGDNGKDEFFKNYKNIDPNRNFFATQEECFKALTKGDIDGFLTLGGIVSNDIIYRYPEITQIAQLDTITSDMTISGLKENKILIEILNTVIKNYENTLIKDSIENANQIYIRKILRLTDKELSWLENDGTATVGVADDYLPFDYYNNGSYQGVGGAVLNEIASLVGIKLNAVHGNFDSIYDMALNRNVDIVNMAKTKDRLKKFIFPSPFSEERDQIYGKRNSSHIQDVYGLEGKKIAVIDGFWHEEYLIKNLETVNIISSSTVEDSLKLVNSGKADYFIENPTVAEFYINGLAYNDIVKKGSTSGDSFLYFGVNNEKPELASIMDKTMKVISYDSLKDKGLMNIPALTPPRYKQLFYIIIFLLAAVIAAGVLMFRILKSLAEEKIKSELLSERNELIYTDALTGMKNRMYFKDMEQEFDTMPFPQVIIHADVNDLKKINDNYGHHMGDKLIIASAKILQSVFENSMIFRMGGDEFLIIAYKITADQINEKIKLVNEIASFTVLDDSLCSIKGFSIAMGYKIRTSSDESFDDAMITSDNNMYIHKKMLKNSY